MKVKKIKKNKNLDVGAIITTLLTKRVMGLVFDAFYCLLSHEQKAQMTSIDLGSRIQISPWKK